MRLWTYALVMLAAALGIHAEARGAAPLPRATPGPVTVVLVLDRSGSMSGEPIAAVRAAATAVVDRLRPTDHLAVVIFDSQPRLVLPRAAVGDRKAARAAVAGITAAGGTDHVPALRQAADQLARAPQGRRLVVLLSDGQAPVQGLDAAVKQLVTLGAEISTIAFGASADRVTLARVAQAGRGRAYVVTRPAELQAATTRELQLLGR